MWGALDVCYNQRTLLANSPQEFRARFFHQSKRHLPSLGRQCIVDILDSLLVERVAMNYTIEHEQEEDGRWLAEVLELPGILAYGDSVEEAVARAQALALRVIADRLEHGEAVPRPLSISFAAA